MIVRIWMGVLFLVIPVLAGCSVYKSSYSYQPRPLEAQIEVEEEVVARVLLSVVGIRRVDKDAGFPQEIEIRVRIENRSSSELTFLTEDLLLVSADLVPFLSPRFGENQGRVIPAKENRTLTFYFGFPEREKGERKPDLDGLNLNWAVACRSKKVTVSSTFERAYYGDDDYYPYNSYWRFGFGYRGSYCY